MWLASLWGVAWAQQTPQPGLDLAEEADVAFERGVQHMQEREYLDALTQLLKSNRLAPNKNVLYNIAGAYEALGRYEQAYQYYAEYVLAEQDPRGLADGQRGLDRLAPRVALVEVRSDPPGSAIYIDRRDLGERGRTPRTFALPPGRHKIMVESEGFLGSEVEVEVEVGRLARPEPLPLERRLGSVRVFGEPAGAEIRLEGSQEVLGVVPSTFEVPIGERVLEITHPGYATRIVQIDVEHDALSQLDGTLEQLTGRLVVDAVGRVGARIELDGIPVAFTPAVVDVPIGTHELKISGPGLADHVQTVEVALDQVIEISAEVKNRPLDPFVVSASRTPELLSEAPSPVTVVTSEMIRAIGARNLEDVLEIYVPGMSPIEDHNDVNVAMRGVYASAQQKILVMVDGHRLNSRAYGAAPPDHSIFISPDRIEQIEILRGPGSSLYGNIAFTAVVNIITKQGSDVGGLVARGGAGNHGQAHASLVYGKTWEDDDLVLWGRVTRVEGERVAISRAEDYGVDEDGDGTPDPHAGSAIVDGSADPSAYDLGVRYTFGDLRLMANSRYSKHIEPFGSTGRTGMVYDYDRMRTLMGVGPGLGSQSNHLELGWGASIGEGRDAEITLNYDTNNLAGNTATSYRNHLFLQWQDIGIGGIGQISQSYQGLGSGRLLLGAQVDSMELRDGILLSGADGEWDSVLDQKDRELLLSGRETTLSSFFQLKHGFADPFIVNVGGRLDYKLRREGTPALDIPEQDDIVRFSPRLSVVVRPSEAFSTKLSYADSFVDAPYWYRYNDLDSYAGAVNLTPESLSSLQLTPELTLLDGRFKSTTNVAYQNVRDFIYRDNDAEPGQPFYVNAGLFNAVFIEEEIALLLETMQLRGNATYMEVLAVDNYEALPNTLKINNVPSIWGNLVLDLAPPVVPDQQLWTNLTLRVKGEQLAPIRATSIARPNAAANTENVQPAYALIDLGARLQDVVGRLSLDGRVYNLLDTTYTQGGSVLFPYPQPGRWFLVNAEIALGPGPDRSTP